MDNDVHFEELSVLLIGDFTHLPHVLESHIYKKEPFTIHINGDYRNMQEYKEEWNNIDKCTENGLAICYDTGKIEIVQEFNTNDALQLLSLHYYTDDVPDSNNNNVPD